MLAMNKFVVDTSARTYDCEPIQETMVYIRTDSIEQIVMGIVSKLCETRDGIVQQHTLDCHLK